MINASQAARPHSPQGHSTPVSLEIATLVPRPTDTFLALNSIASFSFDNTFARKLEGFYVPWQPAAAPAPRLLHFDRALADALGLRVPFEFQRDGMLHDLDEHVRRQNGRLLTGDFMTPAPQPAAA